MVRKSCLIIGGVIFPMIFLGCASKTPMTALSSARHQYRQKAQRKTSKRLSA